KTAALFRRERVRIRLLDAEFSQTPQHDGRKTTAAVLGRRTQTLEQRFILLLRFVHDPRVDRRGQQVVRGRDGMDVAREMEVKLLHRDDLAVATARGATLDSERRALARLAHAGENLFAQMCAERLAQADSRSGFSLTEWGWRDRRDGNVLSIRAALEAVADRKVHLGLALAVQLELVGENASFGRDPLNRDRFGSLSDIDITRHMREHVLQLMWHASSPRRHFGQFQNPGIRGG